MLITGMLAADLTLGLLLQQFTHLFAGDDTASISTALFGACGIAPYSGRRLGGGTTTHRSSVISLTYSQPYLLLPFVPRSSPGEGLLWLYSLLFVLRSGPGGGVF